MVGDLPVSVDPALLVGLAPFDDAAIYRIDDATALVSTTDFFPPLVDDPSDYGAIAAANACSDVFAMGGRVVLAINVAAFPEHFPRWAMAAIFDAAATVVAEAGGTVAGGHTIRNPEPVFGLAVQGLVHPDRVFRKGGARPGDVVLLSKPLGTGLTLAGGDADEKAAATVGMRTLNRAASEAAAVARVGRPRRHRRHRLRARRARLGGRRAQRRPARRSTPPGWSPTRARVAAAERGVRTGGDARNRDYVAGHLDSAGVGRRRGAGASTRRRPAGCWPPSTRPWPPSWSAPGSGPSARSRPASRPWSCDDGIPSDDRRVAHASRPVISKKRAPTRSIERELWDLGHDVVVGIDEVGRGAWAGPLMVGAVILPRDRRVNGIRDSKLLTERRARAAVRPHRRRGAWRGASARRRRSSATSSACRRPSGWPPSGPSPGSASRPTSPSSTATGTSCRRTSATSSGGSRPTPAASASPPPASWPRSCRDREMREHAEHYPPWSFDTNKGYPCPVHKAALQAYGPSGIHRRTWVFMDHYVPWPGVPRIYRPDPDQPALF